MVYTVLVCTDIACSWSADSFGLLIFQFDSTVLKRFSDNSVGNTERVFGYSILIWANFLSTDPTAGHWDRVPVTVRRLSSDYGATINRL